MLVLCKHEDIYLSILYFFLLQKNNICRSTTLLLRIIILYVHIPQNNSQLATFLLDIIIPWEHKYIIVINIQKIIYKFATLHFCKRDYVELRTFSFISLILHACHLICISWTRVFFIAIHKVIESNVEVVKKYVCAFGSIFLTLVR